MRVNFSDVSIMGVVTTLISTGAAGYTYFKGKKTREALDEKIAEMERDQDRRLKRFDTTVSELEEQTKDGTEITLAQDIQERIMYDVATEVMEKETEALQKKVTSEYKSAALNAARDEAEAARRELSNWTKDEFMRKINSMDIRSERDAIVRDVKRDLKKDCEDRLDDFEQECRDKIRRVSDSASDSASEVYKVAKDIREKAMK